MNNQEEIVTGNYFNKYESKNRLYQMLMSKYRATLVGLIKELSISNCLEIGSGEGYTLDFLHAARPDVKYFGSDISILQCESGKSNRPYAEWLVQLGDNISMKTSSFDIVIACEVLEHVKNPGIVLKEMQRVSNKFILLSVPHEPMWRILNILRLKYLNNFGNTPGHLNHWSPQKINSLVTGYFNPIQLKISFPWVFILGEKT